MKVEQITMDPDLAAAKLDAYRAAMAERHEEEREEYRSAIAGFEALSKGKALIDAPQSIRAAGWRDDGRPVFGFARADQRYCDFALLGSGRQWDGAQWVGSWAPLSIEFRSRKSRRMDMQRSLNLSLRINDIKAEPPVAPKAGVAMVPMVPADVLPRKNSDLSKRFVLWEVESWDMAPPVDPILLRHLVGPLYVVEAAWDLTELERAIIASTRGDANA